jgi:hypothetical protein
MVTRHLYWILTGPSFAVHRNINVEIGTMAQFLFWEYLFGFEFSVLCLCSVVNTNSGLQTTYRRTDRYLRNLHYFGYLTF